MAWYLKPYFAAPPECSLVYVGQQLLPLQIMSVPADIAAAAQASSTAAKSLYVGNLSYFVTEDVLRDIFSTLGRVAECKVIKDKQTGLPAGYGFVRFEDHRCAHRQADPVICMKLWSGKCLQGTICIANLSGLSTQGTLCPSPFGPVVQAKSICTTNS